MKIFIDDNKIKPENFKIIKESFKNIEFINKVENSYECEAIFVEPGYVTEDNLKKHTKLKWIQSYRAGYDVVDFTALNKRNIVFTNAKDIYSIAIAEDVIAKMLILNRNVKKYYKNMEERKWQPNFNEPEIYNSTVGIIGVGSIAKEIAKRLKAFNTTIIGFRKNYKQEMYFDEILTSDEGLNNLLARSDYVILAVPLNEDTRGLITKEKLLLMKPTAVLINIARGEVVVQKDLIEILKDKKIRAAALDVVSPEPLPKDSELWGLDNVYLTPHCSAASPHINARLTNLFIENIDRFIKHKNLLNIVD